MDKNELLLLISNIINEENNSKKISLVSELENILKDLFGKKVAFNLFNDIICNIDINAKKRLQIMDTILEIKGLN